MIFWSVNGEIVADSDTNVISIRPCYDKTKSAQKFIHDNAEGDVPYTNSAYSNGRLAEPYLDGTNDSHIDVCSVLELRLRA